MKKFIFRNVDAFKKARPNSPLRFVHDDGVYLLAYDTKKKPIPVYAVGHGPGTHMGGDDFVETMGALNEIFNDKTVEIHVKMSATTLTAVSMERR